MRSPEPTSPTAAPSAPDAAAADGGASAGAQLPAHFFDADAVPVSGGLRREHKVVPGVYFTPGAAGGGGSGSSLGGGGDGAVDRVYTDLAMLGRDDLVAAERETAKNVAKMRESNVEMREFDPDGADPDLVQAVRENEVSIQKAEERLEIMRRRLKYLDPTGHTVPAGE